MKHDNYVDRLESLLKGKYDKIMKNYSIYGTKSVQAEADLIGIKDDKIDVYEVKCSYRIHKAEKQLKRLKRLMHATHTYFYCGSSGALVEIRA